MNIFKGLFDILNHHLIEGLEVRNLSVSQRTYFWDHDQMERWIFIPKPSRFFVFNDVVWKNKIWLLSMFGSADILENNFNREIWMYVKNLRGI